MYYLYIFALLLHVAFSNPCQDETEIVSIETKNPEDLIGNWTYVYRWENPKNVKKELVKDMSDHPMKCPEISFSAITPEYVKAKEDECNKRSYSNLPFKWSDAKLRVDSPLSMMWGSIIFMGDKENWLMSDCNQMVKIVMKKVSDNFMVLNDPDVPYIFEMIAKKTPTLEDLKCVAHNVDIGKNLSGFACL